MTDKWCPDCGGRMDISNKRPGFRLYAPVCSECGYVGFWPAQVSPEREPKMRCNSQTLNVFRNNSFGIRLKGHYRD